MIRVTQRHGQTGRRVAAATPRSAYHRAVKKVSFQVRFVCSLSTIALDLVQKVTKHSHIVRFVQISLLDRYGFSKQVFFALSYRPTLKTKELFARSVYNVLSLHA